MPPLGYVDSLVEGWHATEEHVEYDRLGDMPYPTIKQEVFLEGKTVWLVNRKPYTRGCPSGQIKELKHSQ